MAIQNGTFRSRCASGGESMPNAPESAFCDVGRDWLSGVDKAGDTVGSPCVSSTAAKT
jgi:hypothetical protein